MNAHSPLHIFLLILLAAINCSFTTAVFAAGAGTVTRLAGDASILSGDGKSRVPGQGAPVNQGDTAITGKDGQIDIRFSDESVVQLRPRSQFRVDEYVYGGKQDSNAKSFFSLLRGSMRTITGMIGKLYKPAYAVITPSATIGIRGTEYSATVEKGLHVSVEHGEISLTNRAGSFAVSEGQSAFVPNQNSVPQYLQSGGDSRHGGARNQPSGNTQIRGNTRINASANSAKATATGQNNAAANKAGVIGGD